MKNPGVIAMLIGVAIVVYFMLPLLWIRFLNSDGERLLTTLGAVLIAWGALYMAHGGRRSN